MADTNVNITNTSPKLMALCMVLIMMNTCMSMAYQEQVAKTQKQQLEQAKKQYTLDSLRYENTLRFQDEYLNTLKQKNNKSDSITSALNKNTVKLTNEIKQRNKHNQEVFNYLKDLQNKRVK